MKLGTYVLLFLAAAILPAAARDTRYLLSIQDFMQSGDAVVKLGNNVRFYFGDQASPSGAQQFDTYVTNQKANSFGRPDQEACRRAMLDAMIELRARAEKLGANAVVKIVSYYKKDEFSSETQYECHAGGVVAGVALKGLFVKTGTR